VGIRFSSFKLSLILYSAFFFCFLNDGNLLILIYIYSLVLFFCTHSAARLHRHKLSSTFPPTSKLLTYNMCVCVLYDPLSPLSVSAL
jgi:hypothetical protein